MLIGYSTSQEVWDTTYHKWILRNSIFKLLPRLLNEQGNVAGIDLIFFPRKENCGLEYELSY